MTLTLQQKFDAALQKDKHDYVKSYIISWDYQEKRKKRNKKYSSGLPEDFYDFKNPASIVNWINWFSGEYPSFYNDELILPLYEKAKQTDIAILKKLGIEYNFSNYKNVGLNNAHDFFIPHCYPVPKEFEIKNVLDFGAGYGRQANLWWPHVKGHGNFIAIDAIPLSYGLQYYYYKAIHSDFKDYIDQPDSFKINKEGSNLYHLPTWRLDLVPANSLDLIICVQVLPELSKRLIIYLFQQFQRMLKPGGALYIRDLNYMYKTIGAIDIDKKLISHNFTLEYRAFIEHNKHLHGIPKIWRKNIDRFINSGKRNMNQKKRFLLEDIDALTQGIFNKKTYE